MRRRVHHFRGGGSRPQRSALGRLIHPAFPSILLRALRRHAAGSARSTSIHSEPHSRSPFMQITGEMLIGHAAVRGTGGTQRAFNPALNAEISEPVFGLGTRADVERAAQLAAAAFDPYRNLPLARRAEFLEAIADEILALGDELIERAHAESGLPRARLTGGAGWPLSGRAR
ncbi:hypothetical protein G6F46_014260 [Rhizopus delemar]|nr:hypothetical protein G6F46_014260 [Rhizopus delemar]